MGFESDKPENKLIFKENADQIEILCKNSNKTSDSNVITISLQVLCASICNKTVSSDLNLDISKIKVVNLSNCNLVDLPQCFKSLNLVQLNLSHNNLKLVPGCLFCGLKQLELLDLSFNCLENFDLEPECLHKLKYLKLNNNEFLNAPKWVLAFRAVNLLEFVFNYNKASHYKYLRNNYNLNITKLKRLELINTCLLDEDYDFLKNIKTLEFLDISNLNGCNKLLNKFLDLDLLFVRPQWKNMHVLKLNNLSLSLFPEGIMWLETLRELYITGNSLSWFPEGFEFLANLEILDVSNNEICAVPEKLLLLENLRVIKASCNHIEITPDFAQMSQLQILDLYDNLLDNINFKVTHLTSVDLEYNFCDTNIGDSPLEYEVKKSALRLLLSESDDQINERIDGPKVAKEIFESSSAKSDSDLNDSLRNLPLSDHTFEEDYENWDDSTVVVKNPGVTPSDDEWPGEENNHVITRKLNNIRVYVADEDWMFGDVEES